MRLIPATFWLLITISHKSAAREVSRDEAVGVGRKSDDVTVAQVGESCYDYWERMGGDDKDCENEGMVRNTSAGSKYGSAGMTDDDCCKAKEAAPSTPSTPAEVTGTSEFSTVKYKAEDNALSELGKEITKATEQMTELHDDLHAQLGDYGDKLKELILKAQELLKKNPEMLEKVDTTLNGNTFLKDPTQPWVDIFTHIKEKNAAKEEEEKTRGHTVQPLDPAVVKVGDFAKEYVKGIDGIEDSKWEELKAVQFEPKPPPPAEGETPLELPPADPNLAKPAPTKTG